MSVGWLIAVFALRGLRGVCFGSRAWLPVQNGTRPAL